MSLVSIIIYENVQNSVKLGGNWKKTSRSNSKKSERIDLSEGTLREYLKKLILSKVGNLDLNSLCFQMFGNQLCISDKEYGFNIAKFELKNENLSTWKGRTFDGVHTSIFQTICFFQAYKKKVNLEPAFLDVAQELSEESH